MVATSRLARSYLSMSGWPFKPLVAAKDTYLASPSSPSSKVAIHCTAFSCTTSRQAWPGMPKTLGTQAVSPMLIVTPLRSQQHDSNHPPSKQKPHTHPNRQQRACQRKIYVYLYIYIYAYNKLRKNAKKTRPNICISRFRLVKPPAEHLSGKVRFFSSPCLGCSPRPRKSCGGSSLHRTEGLLVGPCSHQKGGTSLVRLKGQT